MPSLLCVPPLVPSGGPYPLRPYLRVLTYPQPDSHHHHKVDDDDRDVGRIADALVGREGCGSGVGHGAPGGTVHGCGGGGGDASLPPRPLAPYTASGLMISPSEAGRGQPRSRARAVELLRCAVGEQPWTQTALKEEQTELLAEGWQAGR